LLAWISISILPFDMLIGLVGKMLTSQHFLISILPLTNQQSANQHFTHARVSSRNSRDLESTGWDLHLLNAILF